MENNTNIHKISHSKLSTYFQCPWKFNLSYIQKLRTYKPSIEAIMGTVTHQVIQEYVTRIYTKGNKEGLKLKIHERFSELLKEELKKENVKVDGRINEYLNKDEILNLYKQWCDVIYILRKKRNLYFPLKGFELKGIEINLKEEYEYKNTKVLFDGFIDIVLYDVKNDCYKIYDIKTSKKGWRDFEKKSDVKKSQLHFYKYFYSRKLNIDINKIEVVFLILKRDPYVYEDFPPKYISEFIPASKKPSINKSFNLLNLYIDEVILNPNIEYKKIDSPLCNYCEFNKNEFCKKSDRLSEVEIQKMKINKGNKKLKVEYA